MVCCPEYCQLSLRAAGRKTTGKPIHQPDRPIRRTRQHSTRIGGDLAAVKRRNHPTSLSLYKNRTDPRYTPSASGFPWP